MLRSIGTHKIFIESDSHNTENALPLPKRARAQTGVSNEHEESTAVPLPKRVQRSRGSRRGEDSEVTRDEDPKVTRDEDLEVTRGEDLEVTEYSEHSSESEFPGL